MGREAHRLGAQAAPQGGIEKDFDDFSSKDLAGLVAVVGSSLTEVRIRCGLDSVRYQRPLWKPARDSVVPAGLLRSLVVKGILADVLKSYIEPLGQLAGSLEVLARNKRGCFFAVPLRREGV